MQPQDIDKIVVLLRRATRQWKQPVVSQFRREPFNVLISCVLSLRTKDETTRGAWARLFGAAPTPQDLLKLPVSAIERLIYPVGFYRTKAKAIKKICKTILNQYNGRVPNEIDKLLKLPNVGRKTANLVVSVGFGKPGICVDTHVHRICNRLGYVKTKTPDETEMALRKKLPQKYWIKFNDLLVSYGQNLCLPVSPFCGRCVIKRHCQRLGVLRSR